MVRKDGSPHVAPIWFVLDGDDFVFNTGATTIKGYALRRDGRAMICVDDDRPPFAFVTARGTVTISDDLDEMLPWSTRIAARYMGADRAEQFGRRNAVAGELLVRLTPTHVIAEAAPRRLSLQRQFDTDEPAAAFAPRLDDEVVGGLADADDDELLDVDLEEIEVAFGNLPRRSPAAAARRRRTRHASPRPRCPRAWRRLRSARRSAVALCNAKRGSRCRSAPFREPGIDPSHTSPFQNSASMPLDARRAVVAQRRERLVLVRVEHLLRRARQLGDLALDVRPARH